MHAFGLGEVPARLSVEALAEVPSDSRPVVQLVRAEPGLRVRLSVAPLGLQGPRFAPGVG
ncbi:MAG: hypothetical protein RL701_6638, partial [Pseudomonadota bacterium]